MSDALADLIWNRRPTAERPLLGQTVLVVEDSRFACEAMRLLCLRSGARIRRADSLRSAARHLSVYRPSVVIVDIGLPDGSGTALLRDLSRAQPRVAVLLAISGDDAQREAALAAGADDFLPKPFTSLAAFQAAVLAQLPPRRSPRDRARWPRVPSAPTRSRSATISPMWRSFSRPRRTAPRSTMPRSSSAGSRRAPGTRRWAAPRRISGAAGPPGTA
jgi:DNA-binding response OmpR family regulator